MGHEQHMNKSAAMAIRIIRIIRRSIHPLSTTEVARRVETDYGRAYKILLALEVEGIVERDEAHGLDWCPADGLEELAFCCLMLLRWVKNNVPKGGERQAMKRLNLNQEVVDLKAEVADFKAEDAARDEAVMSRVVRAATKGRDMDREQSWRDRAERLYQARFKR